MGIQVLRGGVTANRWSGYGKNIQVGYVSGYADQKPVATVRFYLDSKGGGETEVLVKFDPESFEDLARAMMNASPEAAVRAFGSVLATFTPSNA